MTPTREAVVAEAKSWLRTPWLHEAHVKGVGVDCAQLLRIVLVNCGATIRPTDHYPRDWHCNRDAERFMGFVLEYCVPINDAEILPGDILLWRVGRCYSHGAFYLGGDEILHAVAKFGFVALGNLSELDDLAWRPRKAFRWKGFAEASHVR